MSVITIFGAAYCSAKEIANQVAQRLQYAPVGEELLQAAAQRSGMSTEKLGRALRGDKGFFDAFTHEFDKGFIYLRAALAEILNTDEQVLTGPAALLVPKTISHVLRVEIAATQDSRVQAAILHDEVEASEANRRVKKRDQDVTQWIAELSSRGHWDPSLYDIRIPLPTVSVDEAVSTICENARKPALIPTESSIQTVADFQLEAKIQVALLERGHHNCEVTSTEGRVEVVATQQAGPGKLSRAVHALRWESLTDDIRALREEMDDAESIEARPGSKPQRTSRTLLVDDEQEYVMTLSDRLNMRDIASDVVLDGEQALTYVSTDRPDVMVLDLRMPGMDGLEVLRRIKRDHPQIQVIIVTGHGDEADEKAARELGAFDYLQKPVDINILAETIKQASHRALEESSSQSEEGKKDKEDE